MIKIVVIASCKQLAQISLSWLLHAFAKLWKNLALKHTFAKHSLSSKQDWVLLCTIEVILGFHVLFNCHKES